MSVPSPRVVDHAAADARWTVRAPRTPILSISACLVALALALPTFVLMLRAVTRGLLPTIGAQVIVDALTVSLITTAVSLVLVIAAGLPLALALARGRLPASTLIETIIDLPIVLPPSVAGLALLLVFGRQGVLGQPLDAIGVHIPFTMLAVVFAQAFVAGPFFIRAARAGFSSVEREIEDAARIDGASEFYLFRAVTVPLAAPALTAGIVMSWARSLGEFGATIMFAGNLEGRTQTLPLVVYGEFQGGNVDGSVAAAAVLVLAALGVLIAVRTLQWSRLLDVRGGA